MIDTAIPLISDEEFDSFDRFMDEIDCKLDAAGVPSLEEIQARRAESGLAVAA